jgi:hypothetical protein
MRIDGASPYSRRAAEVGLVEEIQAQRPPLPAVAVCCSAPWETGPASARP